MNSLESMRNYMHTHNPQERNTYQSCVVNAAATVTAVGCYYPLRTIGSRWMKGLQATYSVRMLYSGFGYGCIGAHQLFLMSYFNQMIKERYAKTNVDFSIASKVVIGAVSGALSTFTATPFEAKALQMQQGTKGIYWHSYFRGMIPMCFRQMGLSLGMFVFPEIIHKQIENKMDYYMPETSQRQERSIRIVSGLIASTLGAVATHVPELARMKMQAQGTTSLSTSEAFSAAWHQVNTPLGKKLLGLRLGVVAIATVTMDVSKRFYNNQFCSS